MSLLPIQPDGAERLSERVVAMIERLIISGQWGPATRVPPEPELCQQLGVSRSVIRDAMQQLVARGLVVVNRGTGTIVADVNDHAYTDSMLLLLLRGSVTVREALEARAEIEITIAGIAAGQRTADDIDAIAAALALVAEAGAKGDVRMAVVHDAKFHRALLEATHMPVLITLLQPIASVIERTSSPPEEDVDYLDIEEHRAVLKAIRAGQPENARQAMRAHFAFIDDSRYAEILQKPLARVEAPRATPVEDTGAA